MRLHVRAQDGVDAGLIATFAPKPEEQVGVETHGHNLPRRRHYDFGSFPELFVRGMLGLCSGQL